MTTEQIFGILKISETKDENIIQSAYRMELANNHPEDNPEGFKLLREAYEAALEYARGADEKDEEDYGDTPFGHFVSQLKTIYNTFSKRTDARCWSEFLSQDIFSDLEYAEQVKEYLFTYLMDNFRLTNAVYRLLNERYDIVENAGEFIEFLPQGFVDYMINCINDVNDENEFAYEWFKGDDAADYDSFIRGLFELENQIYEGDFSDVDSKIAKMDALNIYHPYYELVKGYADINKGLYEEAYKRAKQLVDAEEYKYSIKNQSSGGELLWLSGHKQEALTVFKRMDDDGVDHNVVKRYLGIAALEDNNFRDAVIYLSAFANSENEEIRSMLEKADYGFIEKCEEELRASDKPIEDVNTVDALAYAYMRRNRNEDAVKFLTGNEIYEENLFTYHKTLSSIYGSMRSLDKAISETEKWIKVLVNRKKEAENKIEELKEKISDNNISGDEMEKLEYELANEGHMVSACNNELSSAYSYKGKLIVNQSFSVRESKKAGFLDRAMTAFEKSDEFAEGSCEPKVNMANLAMMQNEYRKAYEISEKAVELASEYFPALAVRLEAAYETANAQEVIDLFYQITDMYPEYIRGYEYGAMVFLEYHQETDAQNILEKAKEQGVESFGLNVLELKMNYMQEKSAENESSKNNKKSKADDKYLKLIQKAIDEQDEKTMEEADKRFLAELYYMISTIKMNDNENEHTIAEIKEPAVKAAALCKSRRYIYNAADVYRISKDYRKSLEMLEKYEKMCEPAAGVYLDMIECYDFTGQWSRAEIIVKKAIAAAGNNTNIYKWLGMIYDNHARRVLDRGGHYDVMKYWKLYLEREPEMALLCHIKIADAAVVVDEWDIAIDNLKAALNEDFQAAKAADEQNDLDIDNREEIYVKLVRTYIYKRDFNSALQYTDFLSDKKSKCYYKCHFKGLIYEKLKDYDNAVYWYNEGINKCSDKDDRFDLAESLKLLYKRRKMYKEAKRVLDDVQKKSYSEKAYVYNKIKLERAAAKTDKKRKAVVKELRSAMNKYETAELKTEMMNMQIYDFGNLEHFYDAKLKWLKEKLETDAIRPYYENIGSIAEAMALAWDINDGERVKELAEDFDFGLESFYGNDRRRTPIGHYLADYSDGLENMCKVIIYYVCTGQTDKADELIKDFEAKDLCSFCTISICTERFQALGIYYEAKGNKKLACEYYQAAVDNGIMDSFANYKIARARL